MPSPIKDIDINTDPQSMIGLLPKYERRTIPIKEQTKFKTPINPVTDYAFQNPPK